MRARSLARLLVVLLASIVCVAPIAEAQVDEDDPFAGIETMVVVGTSASGLLQSQEVSVVGFDSDYLEALGASDLSDIAQFTPNLEIRTPFAASNPTLFIRGVGLRDFNANSSSSVAVYNDDIYMNSPAGQLAQLFDVQNVDVLRGPQGGIYGRNASAGAIRVISRKPTGTPGGYLNATYGRFQQIDVEGAVETPLIPDTLSVRISGKMSRRGGTTKNRCGDPQFADDPGVRSNRRNFNFQQEVYDVCFNGDTTGLREFGGLEWPSDGDGTRAPVKERVNDINNWASRALVRLQLDVMDGLDILFNVHGGQSRGDARQFQMIGARQRDGDVAPTIDQVPDTRDIQNDYIDTDNLLLPGVNQRGDPSTFVRDPYGGRAFEGEYNNVEKEKLDLIGGSIAAELTSGNWTHKVITGYEWNERDVQIDLDGSPFIGLEPVLKNSSWQVTGEVRSGWDGGNGLSFQLAGMFLYESLWVDNEFELSFRDLREQSYTMRTRYGAGYGELDWQPSETLSLRAGARLNYEEKELKLRGRSVDQLLERLDPTDLDGFQNFLQAEKSEGNEFGFAGDITLSYLPTNDVTFYVKYARGWKGPHINGLVLSPASADTGESIVEPVDPEEVDSVELGIKSLWWEGRIKLNGALFYYDYNDLQVFRLRNSSGALPVNELINADDADVLGAEFDIDIRPFEGIGPPILEGFTIFTSFAWLDTQYTDFTNSLTSSPGTVDGQNPILITTTIDFSGAQLVNAPEFSFVGFAVWPLPTDYGIFIPRFDWSFKDDVFFSPENSELVGQNALWLMNFRLTYKAPNENLEISGWVENLTDQVYTVDVFNLTRFRGAILYAIGDPRTYGLTVKVTF